MEPRTKQIVRKLRNPSPKDFWWGPKGLFSAAADEIERLSKMNDTLHERQSSTNDAKTDGIGGQCGGNDAVEQEQSDAVESNTDSRD